VSTRPPDGVFPPENTKSEPDLQARQLKWTDFSAQSLLDAVPDAILVVNRQGEIVVANVQAIELFGYSHEALIGRLVESLIPPRLRSEHSQHREYFFVY
jgi:PAS domain-containing protein